MIEGQSIVCLSTTDWDEIWGSRQQIMRRFAARNRVLFVERQSGPEHLLAYPGRLARKRRGWRRGLIEVEANLQIWSPPLVWPLRNTSTFCSRQGQARLASHLRPILRSLGFDLPILWIYQPHSGRLIGALGEALSVYHCIDQFKGGATGRKRAVIEGEEAHTIRSADLVLVHSRELLAEKREIRPDCHYVPSAADVDHYARALTPDIARPEGAPEDGRPVAVLMGTLDRRIDWDLLTALCARTPDWAYVFMGEVKGTAPEALRSAPNVRFAGKQPFADLPSWLAVADVGLIPYRMDESTRYINPLKVHEYLAAGLPVVSVPLPEVEAKPGDVFLAGDAEGFAAALRSLCPLRDPASRIRRHEAARADSWDVRVEQISELMESALKGKRVR